MITFGSETVRVYLDLKNDYSGNRFVSSEYELWNMAGANLRTAIYLYEWIFYIKTYVYANGYESEESWGQSGGDDWSLIAEADLASRVPSGSDFGVARIIFVRMLSDTDNSVRYGPGYTWINMAAWPLEQLVAVTMLTAWMMYITAETKVADIWVDEMGIMFSMLENELFVRLVLMGY